METARRVVQRALLVALLLSVTGMLAEMIKRVRFNQEVLLYHQKKSRK